MSNKQDKGKRLKPKMEEEDLPELNTEEILIAAFRTDEGFWDNRPVSPKLRLVRSEQTKAANTGLLAKSVIPHLMDEQKKGCSCY